MKSAEIDEQPATKCSLNEQKQQPGAASASHVCPPSEGEREERWTGGTCVFYIGIAISGFGEVGIHPWRGKNLFLRETCKNAIKINAIFFSRLRTLRNALLTDKNFPNNLEFLNRIQKGQLIKRNEMINLNEMR